MPSTHVLARWPHPNAAATGMWRTFARDRRGAGHRLRPEAPSARSETSSMMPYSRACSAVRYLSRSMSWLTSSSGLAGVVGQHLLHQRPDPQDLARLDLDVGGLAVAALGGRLVDQDPAVRQGQPLALGAGRQDDGGSRRRLPQADGAHVGLDVAHRVVDRGQRRERATRGVDVDLDVAARRPSAAGRAAGPSPRWRSRR